MRGEWNLRDWEEQHWTYKIEKYIQNLFRGQNKIDLTKEDINPYQIWQILESLGWERDDDMDTNGWEQDMWMYFYNPNYLHKIIVFSCGMTFKFEMFLEDA